MLTNNVVSIQIIKGKPKLIQIYFNSQCSDDAKGDTKEERDKKQAAMKLTVKRVTTDLRRFVSFYNLFLCPNLFTSKVYSSIRRKAV